MCIHRDTLWEAQRHESRESNSAIDDWYPTEREDMPPSSKRKASSELGTLGRTSVITQHTDYRVWYCIWEYSQAWAFDPCNGKVDTNYPYQSYDHSHPDLAEWNRFIIIHCSGICNWRWVGNSGCVVGRLVKMTSWRMNQGSSGREVRFKGDITYYLRYLTLVFSSFYRRGPWPLSQEAAYLQNNRGVF